MEVISKILAEMRSIVGVAIATGQQKCGGRLVCCFDYWFTSKDGILASEAKAYKQKTVGTT